MKPKILVLCLLLSLSLCIHSQDEKKYLTVYFNAYITKIQDLPFYGKSYQAAGFFPSFAYHKEVNRLFFQFEVLPILFYKNDIVYYENNQNNNSFLITGGMKQNHFESWLGVLSKYSVYKSDFLTANLLFENKVIYYRNIYEPVTSNLFRKIDSNIAWNLAIGFEIEKPLTDFISISLMPLFALNDFVYTSNFEDNPQLKETDRTVTSTENTFTPHRYSFKIGLKYRFK